MDYGKRKLASMSHDTPFRGLVNTIVKDLCPKTIFERGAGNIVDLIDKHVDNHSLFISKVNDFEYMIPKTDLVDNWHPVSLLIDDINHFCHEAFIKTRRDLIHESMRIEVFRKKMEDYKDVIYQTGHIFQGDVETTTAYLTSRHCDAFWNALVHTADQHPELGVVTSIKDTISRLFYHYHDQKYAYLNALAREHPVNIHNEELRLLRALYSQH